MPKADAINAYENLISEMRTAHEEYLAQYITLIQAAQAKGEDLKEFKYMGDLFLKDMGQKVARFNIDLTTLRIDAHTAYNLNDNKSRRNFIIFVNEEVEKFTDAKWRWWRTLKREAQRIGADVNAPKPIG
jgi:hypothetical protein